MNEFGLDGQYMPRVRLAGGPRGRVPYQNGSTISQSGTASAPEARGKAAAGSKDAQHREAAGERPRAGHQHARNAYTDAAAASRAERDRAQIVDGSGILGWRLRSAANQAGASDRAEAPGALRRGAVRAVRAVRIREEAQQEGVRVRSSPQVKRESVAAPECAFGGFGGHQSTTGWWLFSS